METTYVIQWQPAGTDLWLDAVTHIPPDDDTQRDGYLLWRITRDLERSLPSRIFRAVKRTDEII